MDVVLMTGPNGPPWLWPPAIMPAYSVMGVSTESRLAESCAGDFFCRSGPPFQPCIYMSRELLLLLRLTSQTSVTLGGVEAKQNLLWCPACFDIDGCIQRASC